MLIVTKDIKGLPKAHWFGPGQLMVVEQNHGEEGWIVSALGGRDQHSCIYFRGTQGQAEAVHQMICAAHPENFWVPSAEELTTDDATIKRIVAETILNAECKAQRKVERDMASQIMADAWLRDNPIGGEK